MKNCSNWDEFRWENEIRQHEHNVAEYFRDLVYCLDLPIGDLPPPPGMAGSPAPADSVAAKSQEAYWQWMMEHDENEDGASIEQDEYEPRHPVCFSCVDSLDQLAVLWNQFAVRFCSGKTFDFALGINCAFGKLLARCADFTEPDEKNRCEPLLRSLGKRTIADLEDLVSRLRIIREIFPDQNDTFEFLFSRLALLRDQLTSKLDELRNSDCR